MAWAHFLLALYLTTMQHTTVVMLHIMSRAAATTAIQIPTDEKPLSELVVGGGFELGVSSPELVIGGELEFVVTSSELLVGCELELGVLFSGAVSIV